MDLAAEGHEGVERRVHLQVHAAAVAAVAARGAALGHVLFAAEGHAAAPAVAALDVDASGVETAHLCGQALAGDASGAALALLVVAGIGAAAWPALLRCLQRRQRRLLLLKGDPGGGGAVVVLVQLVQAAGRRAPLVLGAALKRLAAQLQIGEVLGRRGGLRHKSGAQAAVGARQRGQHSRAPPAASRRRRRQRGPLHSQPAPAASCARVCRVPRCANSGCSAAPPRRLWRLHV